MRAGSDTAALSCEPLLTSSHTLAKIMEATLTDYLESQDDLVREAALALPHQFSQCTYSLGPLRYWLLPTDVGPADQPKASRVSLPDLSGEPWNLLCVLNCMSYEP